MNTSLEYQLVQLLVTYALIGALAVSLVWLGSSLTGHVRFTAGASRRGLLAFVSVNAGILLVGYLTGILTLNPTGAQRLYHEQAQRTRHLEQDFDLIAAELEKQYLARRPSDRSDDFTEAQAMCEGLRDEFIHLTISLTQFQRSALDNGRMAEMDAWFSKVEQVGSDVSELEQFRSKLPSYVNQASFAGDSEQQDLALDFYVNRNAIRQFLC